MARSFTSLEVMLMNCSASTVDEISVLSWLAALAWYAAIHAASLMNEYHVFAEQLAEAAAVAIQPYFRAKLMSKTGGTWVFDPVTLADKAPERAMRELIQDRYHMWLIAPITTNSWMPAASSCSFRSVSLNALMCFFTITG